MGAFLKLYVSFLGNYRPSLKSASMINPALRLKSISPAGRIGPAARACWRFGGRAKLDGSWGQGCRSTEGCPSRSG